MRLAVVAWSSGPYGDVRVVTDGRGDYQVVFPYDRQIPPTCATCQSRTCRHVHVALRESKG